MTGPLYLPTTRLVADAWLQMAVPGVRVGEDLPALDEALRTGGFIRTSMVAPGSNPVVPMREPVVGVECWFPPPPSTSTSPKSHWRRAEQLGERIWTATFDTDLMGVLVDLSAIGDYRDARVHTVTALGLPQKDEDDESDWARYDLDLLFLWTAE